MSTPPERRGGAAPPRRIGYFVPPGGLDSGWLRPVTLIGPRALRRMRTWTVTVRPPGAVRRGERPTVRPPRSRTVTRTLVVRVTRKRTVTRRPRRVNLTRVTRIGVVRLVCCGATPGPGAAVATVAPGSAATPGPGGGGPGAGAGAPGE